VHTVAAVHVTYTDRDYTNVTVDTGHGPATIVGTAHHLYWDASTRAWTTADHLRVGERLQTTDGATVTITALYSYTAIMVTYNLTITTLHTCYVEAGTTPVLVHNTDLCGTLRNPDGTFFSGRMPRRHPGDRRTTAMRIRLAIQTMCSISEYWKSRSSRRD
jgi:Pretoxin HINT domain